MINTKFEEFNIKPLEFYACNQFLPSFKPHGCFGTDLFNEKHIVWLIALTPKVGKVCPQSKLSEPKPAPISGFRNIKRLGVLLLPLDGILVHLGGESYCES